MSPIASASVTANGLAAEIVCCAAPLARVADALAALSCEASAADSFADVFTNFRQAVRALDAQVPDELDAGQGKEDLLMLLATQFVTSAHFMCKMSVDRTRLCAGSIADAELRDELVAGGIDAGDLKGTLGEILTHSDSASVLRRAYEQLLRLRDCLAWEAAVAMAVIETDSSIEKPQATSVLMLLRDHAADGKDVPRVNSTVVAEWRTKVSLLFDPKCSRLKEILEGKKETRRLPKIPKGGELCSLRYDLTVPFARYLAMKNKTAMRRYQIAKVYRRDNPANGRYREFYQCDFDIAGVYEPMEADFEVIKVLTELLDKLDIGMYEIKLNHRKLLDGMLDICGVPSDKFRTVCSSIDKLDKLTLEQVKKELVEEKGVSNETAEKIGSLVGTRGPPLEVLTELRKEGSKFTENDGSVVALNELEILFKALEKANALDRIIFDLSLARGLDYYTGVIYEAVLKDGTQVGSIAAGGRYDNLVGDIVAGKQIPIVGVSLGIDRVFPIMEQQVTERNQVIRTTETEVLVSILGKDLTVAAELVTELWGAGIKAEFKLSTRMQSHTNYALKSGIPWMVLVGESEIRDGKVKLKDISARKEEEVPRMDFAQVLKQRLTNP